MMFKGNKVYAEVDSTGRPLVRNGRVRIKYRENDERMYEAKASNLVEIDQEKLEREQRARKMQKVTALDECGAESRGGTEAGQRESMGADEILIYTDGASHGNPGEAGIGVVLKYRQRLRTISKHVGCRTSNEAELLAVKEGLMAVKNRRLPVRVVTDSEYVQGVLWLGWKARAHAELVYEIRQLMKEFASIRFETVRGHKGHEENELADSLAWKGAKAGKS